MEKDWKYSKKYKCTCKVVEEHTLWGQTINYVWLANSKEVVCVPNSDLEEISVDHQTAQDSYRIAYVTAATKISELLEQSKNNSDSKTLIAPMEANVIPLPHQIHALSRIVSGDRVRYLLADEVGLGKTIEAGLAIRELKMRGLILRTLVVAPKSLAVQWIAELNTHFNETFKLINPSELEIFERLDQHENLAIGVSHHKIEYNPWLRFPQVVVTMDAVKPVNRHKNWTKEKVEEYNRNRFEKLVQGQWDLVVIDEAHHMGGSSEHVARFLLGQRLAEAAPFLLLLSATPHQGKSDAFQRLMSMIDPLTFPNLESVNRKSVREFVIRTEKRKAISTDGKPLFSPRITRTLEVDLQNHQAQFELYEAVTKYVKEGYNRAIKNRLQHVGFLMVLLQRIVTSSTNAIRETLEKRLQMLESLNDSPKHFSEYEIEDILELDAQLQLDIIIEVDELARSGEVVEVKKLIELACIAEKIGPDAKTDALMNLIFQLQGEENDDKLKIIIFTEFISTQSMLHKFLEERGFSCTILNGSMNMNERQLSQYNFSNDTRILISTDAGGEGLNLQFCHVVVNYDLPWNPMRIEQRIGRVDRIGQKKTVRAINFVYQNSVEARVREVLESKLSIINNELGVNKSEDVLNSSISGNSIEKMITQVVMESADINKTTESTLKNIQNEITERRENCEVYQISEELDSMIAEKTQTHPLPHWIERMTINFLKMNDCKIEKNLVGWNLNWLDGQLIEDAIFNSGDSTPDCTLLTLENPRIRELVKNLDSIDSQNSLPCVELNDLPESVNGLWGLFEIRMLVPKLDMSKLRIPTIRSKYLCIFLSKDGDSFLPTARHIWDKLITEDINVLCAKELSEANEVRIKLTSEAKRIGRDLFSSMNIEHLETLKSEEKRGQTAFTAQKRAIERSGLKEVRQFRLNHLENEEKQWKNELNEAREVLPEIRLLQMLKIGVGVENG